MPSHMGPIHIAGFIWAMFLTVAVVVAAQKISAYFREKRLQELSYLRSYCNRLRTVVAEMLAEVNDLDQSRPYQKLDKDDAWARRLGKACEELVSLSESLPLLVQLIEGNNARAGRDHLLKSCRMAEKISAELIEMGVREGKAIGGKSSPGDRPDIGS